MLNDRLEAPCPARDVFVRASSFGRLVRLRCPPRKDEADWLVELTGDSGKPYRIDPAEREDMGIGKVPVTAKEFHERWLASEGARALNQASLSTHADVCSSDIKCRLCTSRDGAQT